MAHTIHCAHDDCDEYSCRAPFQPEPPDLQAIAHRAALAADGWSDIEGRDYCPDHRPR
jgi:hypothetical protein